MQCKFVPGQAFCVSVVASILPVAVPIFKKISHTFKAQPVELTLVTLYKSFSNVTS